MLGPRQCRRGAKKNLGHMPIVLSSGYGRERNAEDSRSLLPNCTVKATSRHRSFSLPLSLCHAGAIRWEPLRERGEGKREIEIGKMGGGVLPSTPLSIPPSFLTAFTEGGSRIHAGRAIPHPYHKTRLREKFENEKRATLGRTDRASGAFAWFFTIGSRKNEAKRPCSYF